MSPQTGIWTDFAAESRPMIKTDLLFLREQAKKLELIFESKAGQDARFSLEGILAIGHQGKSTTWIGNCNARAPKFNLIENTRSIGCKWQTPLAYEVFRREHIGTILENEIRVRVWHASCSRQIWGKRHRELMFTFALFLDLICLYMLSSLANFKEI